MAKSKWMLLHINASGAKYYQVYRLYNKQKEDTENNREVDGSFDDHVAALRRCDELNDMEDAAALPPEEAEGERAADRVRYKIGGTIEALRAITLKAQRLEEIDKISNAMKDAAHCLYEDNLRTVIQALGDRLFKLAENARGIEAYAAEYIQELEKE